MNNLESRRSLSPKLYINNKRSLPAKIVLNKYKLRGERCGVRGNVSAQNIKRITSIIWSFGKDGY